jgi:hypothetical protein
MVWADAKLAPAISAVAATVTNSTFLFIGKLLGRVRRAANKVGHYEQGAANKVDHYEDVPLAGSVPRREWSLLYRPAAVSSRALLVTEPLSQGDLRRALKAASQHKRSCPTSSRSSRPQTSLIKIERGLTSFAWR